MMKKLLMIVVAVMIAVMIGGTAHAELIVAYGFNGSLADVSGNGYDGIGDGAIAYAADVPEGLSGTSLVLDGDGTVEAPISEVNPFDGSGDFSIAIWLKTDQAGIIISSARDNAPENQNLTVWVQPSGRVMADNFYVGSVSSDALIDDGQWHHLVVLYTPTDYTLVIDGVSSGSNGIDFNIPNIVEDTVLIGNSLNTDDPASDGAAGFIGNLKDLAIFNHILSDEEIADLMANGLSPVSAKDPDPSDGDTVLAANPLRLSWTNMDPTDSNDLTYVDVLWGTEPNALSPGYDMTLVVTATNVDFVDVDSSAIDTYYWRVDSYPNGADKINEPNMVEGRLWSYITVSDVAPTVEIVTPDQMTWLGEGVPLDAAVEDDGRSALTYLWTADPAPGVAFDSDSIANPIVTFTNRILIRSIQATNDDAEEHVNTQAISGAVPQGTMVLDSSDLELGSEGNGGLDWQVIAVQYNQLGIPQGSTITSAKLTFQVDNSGAAGISNDFTILAEAADDASVFEDVLNNITDRARSAASVAWAPDWGTGPVVGTKVDTPDITTLIQEVVDREDWSDNNRLTLMIYPDVYLASPTGGTTTVQEIEFEANPGSDSATLTVTYEPPAGSPPLSDVSTYTITVAVSDEANPTPDTASIEIDVYDDACQMAKFGQGRSAITDFNANCITGLEELVVMVGAWLDDYSATGAGDRP